MSDNRHTLALAGDSVQRFSSASAWRTGTRNPAFDLRREARRILK